MENKRELLKLLLECDILTGNLSKFVSALGYKEKSRSTIGRIKRGEGVSDKKLGTLWEMICKKFDISDETLATIADSVRRIEAYPPKLRNEILEAFITEKETEYTRPEVCEMKRCKEQEPDTFYLMLAYIYIKSKYIHPYTIKGRRALKKDLWTLNDTLYSQFQAINAPQFTKETIANIIARKDVTTLELIHKLAIIIRVYMDSTYLKRINSRTIEHLNIKDGTFWIENGKEFCKDCELWYFRVNKTVYKEIGAYIIVKLTAQSEPPHSFKLMDKHSRFSFSMNGNILQMNDIPSREVDHIDSCTLDEKRGLLHFVFHKNSVRNKFGLPFTLEMLNHAGEKGERMEKLMKITDSIREEELESFIQDAVNSDPTRNMEFLTDEMIVNVQIDFNKVIVTSNNNDKYQIDRNKTKYPFLMDLTATLSEAACFVHIQPTYDNNSQNKEEGVKCIYWDRFDKYIPLYEFEKIVQYNETPQTDDTPTADNPAYTHA